MVSSILQKITPPVLWRMARKLSYNTKFFGDFSSFEEALKECSQRPDYEKVTYIEPSVAAARELQAKPMHPSQLTHLSYWLLPINDRANPGEFRVLDFGGGMGHHYFQLKTYFPEHIKLRWNVVETQAMARQGNELLRSDELRFSSEFTAADKGAYDLVAEISVISYIDDPVGYFRKMAATEAKYIFLWRFTSCDETRDRLGVAESFMPNYHTKYPSWIFSKTKWKLLFEECGYEVKFEWPHPEAPFPTGKAWLPAVGILLKRR